MPHLYPHVGLYPGTGLYPGSYPEPGPPILTAQQALAVALDHTIPVYPYPPTSYHQDLYEAHQPINYADPTNSWPWYMYVGAIASMFDQVETYVRDQDDGTPGWGIILDIDRCPVEALPWLAQFVGVVLPGGLTEDQQRARIKNVDGFARGSIGGMISSLQEVLTGTKTVYFKERDSGASSVAGGAYGLTVISLTSETPDPVLARQKLMANKPAGIILDYTQVTGASYVQFRTTYTTYTAMDADFVTYAGMRNNEPGT